MADGSEIVVSPKMLEAGFDAASRFVGGVSPGKLAAAVTSAYYAMRRVDEAAAKPIISDPTISRRRAEALKPFIDHALALHRGGWLENPTARIDGFGGLLASDWSELIEAFKPETVSVEG